MIRIAKKISTIVTEFIVKEIKRGKYMPGDKLPSERELMEIVDVGRSSIRESLNTLSDMGVLEKRMGIGVFVKKSNVNNLADAYVISALLDSKTAKELLDFRLILEVENAGRAALLATEKELLLMEEAIEMHKEAIDRKLPSIEADNLFHKSIVLATRNNVLIKVYESITELIESFKQDLLKVESKNKSLEFHLQIYEAIKNKDEEGAKLKMKEHLLDVTRRFEYLNHPEQKTRV